MFAHSALLTSSETPLTAVSGRLCSRTGSPDQEFEGEEIGQRQHTVWVPWSDVPIGESGLVVVEGSHRLPGFAGLRESLGKVDVNYTDISGGFSFSDPAEVLAYDPEARLVTEDFRGAPLPPPPCPSSLLFANTAILSQRVTS